jgi:hypothetical protein
MEETYLDRRITFENPRHPEYYQLSSLFRNEDSRYKEPPHQRDLFRYAQNLRKQVEFEDGREEEGEEEEG